MSAKNTGAKNNSFQLVSSRTALDAAPHPGVRRSSGKNKQAHNTNGFQEQK
jgi:hypothetical protein